MRRPGISPKERMSERSVLIGGQVSLVWCVLRHKGVKGEVFGERFIIIQMLRFIVWVSECVWVVV